MGQKTKAVPTDGHVLHLNPKTLTIHPLAESLPMLEETDDKFLTMVGDIGARGIDEPLKIDEQDRVMDGRHRRAAAIAAELPTVPCVRRPGTGAIQIIVGSLFARRHFTKSAQAYLAYPLFETLLAENRSRRLLNLKNAKTPINSRTGEIRRFGETRVENLASNLGIGAKTFREAATVHELFAKRPPLKEEFEPQILSGEMCLWNVLSAVAGRDATKGVTPGKRPPEILIGKALRAFTTQFGRWEKIQSPPARLALQQQFGEALDALPRDLQIFAAKRLREATR